MRAVLAAALCALLRVTRAPGMSLGTFTSYALENNLGPFSGNVPARAVHLSLSIGARLTLTL